MNVEWILYSINGDRRVNSAPEASAVDASIFSGNTDSRKRQRNFATGVFLFAKVHILQKTK